jgi:hypothetical protein
METKSHCIKMKKLILTPEMDPRRIEFYNKAFPNLSPEKRTKLMGEWTTKTLKNINGNSKA